MRTIQRILGLLLMVFSLTMLPPEAVAWIYGDLGEGPFIAAFFILLGAGFLLWLPVASRTEEVSVRQGFLLVALFWAVLGTGAAVPLMISDQPHLSITDSVFEAISGLTTTGATVIPGIDDLPPSMRYYRQQLQWLGGMGIIVLAVAILPLLGVGGMQLYRAETPGPMKDDKIAPRIKETAKSLWYMYLGLTVACAVGFWLAGMSLFDAVGHSFATVSTGGFSTHDASMAYFDSPVIEAVAVVFMALGGVNFALHFRAWHRLSLRPYALDAELRTYLLLLAGFSLLSGLWLYFSHSVSGLGEALREAVFQTVSFMTTTGFTTTGHHTWPVFLPVLLISTSFFGGCGGSTGGGIKVIRILLLFRQGMREIARLIHPNAVFIIKIGGRPLPDRVIDAVWGFFATYVFAFYVFLLAMMATGLDQVSAYSAVIACMNNLGPGLGAVTSSFASVTPAGKWMMSLAMLLGRLEVFTLLVLLSPSFWRR